MYVVTVKFDLDPAQAEAFYRLVCKNAAQSKGDEPGCLRFDVCRNADAPQHVFLYEIYDNRAAFDAHLASDHFKSFDRAVAAMVKSKDIATYDEIGP